MVFFHDPADAFHAVAMPSLVRLAGRQAFPMADKRIAPTGVGHHKHRVRGVFPVADAQLDESFRSACGRFKRIFKQVAEKRGHVRICDKFCRAASDVRMEGDTRFTASGLVAAEDRV